MELSYEPLMRFLMNCFDIGDILNFSNINTKCKLSFISISKDQYFWREKVKNINHDESRILPEVNINWKYMYFIIKKRWIPYYLVELAKRQKYDYILIGYNMKIPAYSRITNIKMELHYYFHRMCQYCNLELIQHIHKFEISNSNYYVEHQALIYAARGDNLEVLKYLMDRCCDNLDFSNHALIRVAIINNSINVVKYLMKFHPYLNPAIIFKRPRKNCIYKIFNRNMRDMMKLLLIDDRVKIFIRNSYIKELSLKNKIMADLLQDI
jgi:hypothetical protein